MNKQNKVKSLTDSELVIRLIQLQAVGDVRTNLEQLLLEAELERRYGANEKTTKQKPLDFWEIKEKAREVTRSIVRQNEGLSLFTGGIAATSIESTLRLLIVELLYPSAVVPNPK